MSCAGIIEMDLRNLANEVKKKGFSKSIRWVVAPEIRKAAESGIETLLVLSKKYANKPVVNRWKMLGVEKDA